jgi:hypothetical protein
VFHLFLDFFSLIQYNFYTLLCQLVFVKFSYVGKGLVPSRNRFYGRPHFSRQRRDQCGARVAPTWTSVCLSSSLGFFLCLCALSRRSVCCALCLRFWTFASFYYSLGFLGFMFLDGFDFGWSLFFPRNPLLFPDFPFFFDLRSFLYGFYNLSFLQSSDLAFGLFSL